MVGGSVMRTRAIAVAAALIVTTGAAHAAEIDAMITTAMKAAVDELAPPFERANGHVLRLRTLRRARAPLERRRGGRSHRRGQQGARRADQAGQGRGRPHR